MEQQAIIDKLIIEKTALDQSYVQEIRNCLELRQQMLAKDKYMDDLNKQIQKLIEEKNDLQIERDELKIERNRLMIELDNYRNMQKSDSEIIES